MWLVGKTSDGFVDVAVVNCHPLHHMFSSVVSHKKFSSVYSL